MGYKLNPITGDVVDSDGNIVNLVDLFGGGEPLELQAPYPLPPRSGLVIGSDGKVYDLTKLISSGTQKEELPEASKANEGKIYQYTGASENGLLHGHFYECENNDNVYSWKEIDMLPAGSVVTATVQGKKLILE